MVAEKYWRAQEDALIFLVDEAKQQNNCETRKK